MAGAARVLAVWLTPVTWVILPALIVTGGQDGLWAGLVLAVAPLIALSLGARPLPAASDGAERLHVAALVLAVGLLVWANLALVGDVVVGLGAPRWHGVIVAAAGGLILAAWRRAERAIPALVVIALIGLGLPLVALGRTSGVGPVAAWHLVASQPAFRFPSESPWVRDGRELASARGRVPIVLEEEHRISAPSGGTIRVVTRDGVRSVEREVKLGAGQSITLRPGDRLEPDPGLRLRFEADKRVPGAPASGVAWAAGGRRREWLAHLALAVTLVGGAIALLAGGGSERASRLTVTLAGGGLVAALLWAQGWAVYGALRAPDLFLGGVTADRVVEVPALAFGGGRGARLQALLLAGLLSGFLASTIALRSRPGRADGGGGAEIGGALGLWAAVFAGAGIASLSVVDPWTVTLWALGAAGSTVAPAVLLASPRRPGGATAASALGLGLFVALWAAGRLSGPLDGLASVAVGYPAVVAAPASLVLRWLAGRGGAA